VISRWDKPETVPVEILDRVDHLAHEVGEESTV
jgi:hypothetical protein